MPVQTSLVAADRLWQTKREVLEAVGFDTPQEFPITVDGMPQQLLSYLRLARLQNSAEFAKVLQHLNGKAPSHFQGHQHVDRQSTACDAQRTAAPTAWSSICSLQTAHKTAPTLPSNLSFAVDR